MEVIKKMREEKGGKIFIKDEDVVSKKIQNLIDGGVDSFQVISDFDRTLSRASYNGEKCTTCHGILESSIVFNEETQKDLAALKKRFYAIEIDPTMTIEEKCPYMVEWWETAHKIMIKSKVKRTSIQQAVTESNVILKDNCKEMFQILNQNSVPLLIFSAGIADVLMEVLYQKSSFLPNIKVVSNFMKFDENGVLVGFEGELIHVYNKNEGALTDSAYWYFEDIKHRHNICLLGDSMGDLHMADGVPDVNTCLKIGYLNEKVEHLLPRYIDAWDIVLVDDPTMDVANVLFAAITDAIIKA
nr:cytosolic 5'-nucleotidase 3-like [Ciona intestinalis]|eukprot:XP_002131716.1 cytosolic 5'-nucleotidase 3-like [Ciona intestinalis]